MKSCENKSYQIYKMQYIFKYIFYLNILTLDENKTYKFGILITKDGSYIENILSIKLYVKEISGFDQKNKSQVRK